MSEGIELPPLDITESDKDAAWEMCDPNHPKYISPGTLRSGYVCRERQLRDALKRIAELEKEKAAVLGLVEGHARIIAALESQQAADREELRVTLEELEKADYLIGRCIPFIDTLIHHGDKEAKVLRGLINAYVTPAATEGGR